MVDLKRTNEKLVTRSENIVMATTGCDRQEAKATLDEAEGSVKLAITAILSKSDVRQAAAYLEQSGGYVRQALELAAEGRNV